MQKIAISYRRDNTGDITGRIFDRLALRYGKKAIFRDIDSIPPGQDYRTYFDTVLRGSTVLLVIIGPQWLGHRPDGTIRIFDLDDPVRVEIEAGLALKLKIIPILVDDARMPPESSLPESIRHFTYLNALYVDGFHDFDYHFERLIRYIDQALTISELDHEFATSNRISTISNSTGEPLPTFDLISHSEDSTRNTAPSTSEVSRSLQDDDESRRRLSRLRFQDQSLEIEFLSKYNEDSLPVVRMALLLAIGLYMIFYLWDGVVDYTSTANTLLVRVVVSACMGSALLLPRLTFKSYLQTIMCIVVTVAGVGVVLILCLIQDGLRYGVGGVVLVLMFNFGFFRLLFLPSLISGFVICAAYNVAGSIYSVSTAIIVSNDFFLVSSFISGASVTYLLERLFRAQFISSKELTEAQAKADTLIETLVPVRIAERLRAGEKVIFESHGEATILSSHLVGFSRLEKKLSPEHLIELLNDIFSMFDTLAEKYGVEKIRNVGDTYIVAGVESPRRGTALAIAEFAIEVQKEIEKYSSMKKIPLSVRVGISTGQVVGGVIGRRSPSFELWGDTVQLANLMQSQSEEAHIQVDEAAYWRLRDEFELIPGEFVHMDGGNDVQTYYLIRRKGGRGGSED